MFFKNWDTFLVVGAGDPVRRRPSPERFLVLMGEFCFDWLDDIVPGRGAAFFLVSSGGV